ncbi:MAG: hypothetical protein JXA57_18425 [Armatimonadetes bacterium]|nr:hypothetical protein [Armatimonadota bacterium]
MSVRYLLDTYLDALSDLPVLSYDGRTARSGTLPRPSLRPGSLTFRSGLRPSLQARLHQAMNNGLSLLLVHKRGASQPPPCYTSCGSSVGACPRRSNGTCSPPISPLSDLPVLSCDGRAARRQAEERARLEATRQAPGFVDGQIAAVAEVNGLVLVTRNVCDFGRFAGIEVEDWFG